MANAKFYLPPICFIVARSVGTHFIGCEGKLPWHLRSDLTRFRNLTTHHAVIMGRKTFDSIGKPLPSRLNVVISRSQPSNELPLDLHGTETKLLHSRSTEDALFCSDLFTILNGSNCVFVIGGAEIYKIFGSRVDRVYLTEVFADIDGDAVFDQTFDIGEWKVSHTEMIEEGNQDQYASTFTIYDRRVSKGRLSSFSSIASKKDSNHVCLRTITNQDEKLIESYASSHLLNKPVRQAHFRFD